MSLKKDQRKLPKGWLEKRLSDICSIKHGFAFKSQFFTAEESDYVLLTPGSFYESGGYRDQGKKTKYYVGEIPDGFILGEGDFLVAMTEQAPGLLGSPLLVPESSRFLHNQRLGLIQVFDDVEWHNKFFFHLFNTQAFRRAVHESASGVKVRHTSPKKLGAISVRFPCDFEEQRRIAAILDEAFEGIDGAIANTEKNLANARELFESYLNAIFTCKGDDWVEKKLGELSEVQSGGTPLRHKSEYWGGDIAWYSSGELNDLYTITPQRHITDMGLGNSNAKLFPKGSLLIGMYDTAALKMSILDRDAAFNQAVAGMKPNENIDLVFMLHALNFVKPEVLSLRRGVRQKNLSLKKIKNIAVVLPGLVEQRRVVEQLASISNETQRLEAIYEQKLAALNELKQSILQRAFSGELTSDSANRLTKEAKEVAAA